MSRTTKLKVSVQGRNNDDRCGVREFLVEGDTALEALKNASIEHSDLLSDLFSDTALLKADVSVLINDKAVENTEMLTESLREGDVISILSSVSGGREMKRRIYLNIPKDIVGQPLLFQVGHEFKVVPNIRGASISDDIGLVALELTGEEPELDRAIEWLTAKGVQIEQIAEPEIKS